MMKKEVPDVRSAVLYRAHRIGKVKFVSFRHRTILYRKRKHIKDLSIRLDLTKARYNLLKMVRQKTNDNDAVDFVYSDVNCRLKVHPAAGQENVFFIVRRF